MHTIELIKQKNERPHGFVNNNVGIILSKLISLFVQSVNVILSLSSFMFNTYNYQILNGIRKNFLIKGWLTPISNALFKCGFL